MPLSSRACAASRPGGPEDGRGRRLHDPSAGSNQQGLLGAAALSDARRRHVGGIGQGLQPGEDDGRLVGDALKHQVVRELGRALDHRQAAAATCHDEPRHSPPAALASSSASISRSNAAGPIRGRCRRPSDPGGRGGQRARTAGRRRAAAPRRRRRHAGSRRRRRRDTRILDRGDDPVYGTEQVQVAAGFSTIVASPAPRQCTSSPARNERCGGASPRQRRRARRAPEQPSGCPRAIAPPFTFSSRGRFRARRMLASTCAANASFSSTEADVVDREARPLQRLARRGTGPTPM